VPRNLTHSDGYGYGLSTISYSDFYGYGVSTFSDSDLSVAISSVRMLSNSSLLA